MGPVYQSVRNIDGSHFWSMQYFSLNPPIIYCFDLHYKFVKLTTISLPPRFDDVSTGMSSSNFDNSPRGQRSGTGRGGVIEQILRVLQIVFPNTSSQRDPNVSENKMI